MDKPEAYSGLDFLSNVSPGVQAVIEARTDSAFAPKTGITLSVGSASVQEGDTGTGTLESGTHFLIKSNTGALVTQMCFRLVALTLGASTVSGVLDLRAISSTGVRRVFTTNFKKGRLWPTGDRRSVSRQTLSGRGWLCLL